MGRKFKNKIKWTEESIQDVLEKKYLSKSSKKYELFNLFVFDWESDYLCITKTGYIHEVEIKISREDFFNDFKNKTDKHNLLVEGKENASPNYFYYCVPENLISANEIPEYAGLIYVINEEQIKIVKNAPKINKNKPILETFNLTDKFYYNLSSWRRKALKTYKNELNLMKEEVQKCKTGIDNKKYKYTIEEAHKRIKFLENELKMKDKYIEHYYKETEEYRKDLRKATKLLKENNINFQF